MNPLASLLQAELLKLRRSWALLLVLVFPIIPTLVVGIVLAFSKEVSSDSLFPVWCKTLYYAWTFAFLPGLVALNGAQTWDLEAEYGTWKHLMALPLPRWQHFAMKVAGLLVLALLAHLVFGLLVLGGAWLVRLLAPPAHMGALHPGLLLNLVGSALLATLPLVALHGWVGSRWNGLAVACGLAVVVLVGTPLLGQLAPAYTAWSPWALTLNAVQRAAGQATPGLLLRGLAVTGLLLALGLLDFRRREGASA